MEDISITPPCQPPIRWAILKSINSLTFGMDNPYYSSVGYLNSVGYSNYNALQVEFRQQPWHGMESHGNYTFSKTLGVTQQYTLRDLRSGYGPANTDRHHVANILGNLRYAVWQGADLPKEQ